MITKDDVSVPADVPGTKRDEYVSNFLKMTRNTGRLMLFAGDQKIEHLNKDFFGTVKRGGQEIPIPEDDGDPEHLFRIADKAQIGVFATQLGLIAKYGPDYKDVPYLVKINSKSGCVKTAQADPISQSLVDIEHVVAMKEASGLNILGVGFTVYVGSENEAEMMAEAGRLATEAHQHGLLAVFWMYPRGQAIENEKCPNLIAGAAGVGACLGADFVKVNYPKAPEGTDADAFKQAIRAAGSKTGVITAGGSNKPEAEFFQETYDQIHVAGCKGNATGRNIHQKKLDEAIRMCDAIASITLGEKDVDFAVKVFEGSESFTAQ